MSFPVIFSVLCVIFINILIALHETTKERLRVARQALLYVELKLGSRKRIHSYELKLIRRKVVDAVIRTGKYGTYVS